MAGRIGRATMPRRPRLDRAAALAEHGPQSGIACSSVPRFHRFALHTVPQLRIRTTRIATNGHAGIARSPALHRRRVQRQSRAGRLGLHPAPSGVGQGNGRLRRRATNHQQPHGADGRGPRAGSPQAPAHVELFTDSEYVGKGLSEWMPKWKANGWRRREGEQLDRGQERRPVAAARRVDCPPPADLYHVAGHSGHAENERCDKLAVAAYQQFLRRDRRCRRTRETCAASCPMWLLHQVYGRPAATAGTTPVQFLPGCGPPGPSCSRGWA